MRDGSNGKRALFIVALLMISLGICSGEEKQSSEDLERFQWMGHVDEGDRIVIDNPYGDVRLRFGGYRGELEIIAVIQLLRSDGAYLQVQPNEVDDGTEIRVTWKMKPGLSLPIPLEGDRSRADLVVMVPLGVTVEVSTDRGLVETKGVRGDTIIKTTSGEIRIKKHQSAVNAESLSGRIEAILLNNATTLTQTFHTRSGSIEVWVAPDASYRAVLTTSGAITTDFSIDIEHLTGAEPDKKGTATLAEEGPELLLSSLRGNVALRRLVELHDGTPQP